MAGSILVTPAAGSSDWSDFIVQTQRFQRGYMALSLSNMTGTSEPKIQSGSSVEVGGSLFQFSAEEGATTGFSAIATASTTYLKVLPASTSITAEFTDTAPTWSDAKQGWYSSNDRYVLELFKNGASSYTEKVLMTWKPGELAVHKRRIGNWNMDDTTNVFVDHGLSDITLIREVAVIILSDVSESYKFYNIVGATVAVSAASVHLTRDTSGAFNSANFGTTSFNRGFITFFYEAS